MDLELSESLQLLQKVYESKLYNKLVAQIQKDFELVNNALSIPLGASPAQLVAILNEKVYFLLMERFQGYLNLLYTIDIPESVFKKIKVTDAVDVSKQVAFFILEREFQKVRLREKYSS